MIIRHCALTEKQHCVKSANLKTEIYVLILHVGAKLQILFVIFVVLFCSSPLTAE